jgi:hypothetical protein
MSLLTLQGLYDKNWEGDEAATLLYHNAYKAIRPVIFTGRCLSL